MAKVYYGVDLGGDMPTDVTTAASTTSKAFEFYVDLSVTGVSKREALKALEAIEYALTQDNSNLPK